MHLYDLIFLTLIGSLRPRLKARATTHGIEQTDYGNDDDTDIDGDNYSDDHTEDRSVTFSLPKRNQVRRIANKYLLQPIFDITLLNNTFDSYYFSLFQFEIF